MKFVIWIYQPDYKNKKMRDIVGRKTRAFQTDNFKNES